MDKMISETNRRFQMPDRAKDDFNHHPSCDFRDPLNFLLNPISPILNFLLTRCDPFQPFYLLKFTRFDPSKIFIKPKTTHKLIIMTP
ncbi:hypothetical protein Hanom_Chr17g01550411 [Helianthus anomalus]